MKDTMKALKAGLVMAILGILLLSVAFVLTTNHLRAELTLAQSQNLFLNGYVQELGGDLETTQTELDGLEAEYAALTQRYLDLESEHSGLKADYITLTTAQQASVAQAELYQSQKYYLTEVVDWLGRAYASSDFERALQLYQASSGLAAPHGCEPVTPDRYLRWGTPPRSTMYVATPAKLGWSPYTFWSVREDVVFGPEHRDFPGYLGSRGYEFRYPLIPGSRFQQEIHTTINVYDHLVDPPSQHESLAVAVVELACGVTGYIRESGDADNTILIYFAVGNYDANVKIKFDPDLEHAMPILVQGANLVINELTNGW